MNRLSTQPSLYLRQHAHNPVHWQPWGEAAWAEAKERNVPVLVSVGYSSCHWCHVMEREVFEKAALAALMNSNLVCIKVDREERPDVDMIYMEAVQRMGLGGGWPLNVFCTPEGEPFYGGTYFPPPNWAQVVREISRAWGEHEDKLRETAATLRAVLQEQEDERKSSRTDVEEPLKTGLTNILRDADWQRGGVGVAPKFPTPALYRFLLASGALNSDGPELAHLTLRAMANGGIYDHLGGGFFRYSTDAEWFAPHFEKMLYDNGQLLSLYAEAYRQKPDPLYKRILEETVTWIEREMTSAEGAFYGSIDADSEGEEGRFYTWTTAELRGILEEEFPRFASVYGIVDGGNWEHGRNILALTDGPNSSYVLDQEARKLLFHAREKRIRPTLDTKVITCWNALATLGLTDAYRYAGIERALQLAERNAAFMLEQLWKRTYLLHQPDQPTEGFLDDYASWVLALASLFEVTGKVEYLHLAEDLARTALGRFDKEGDVLLYYASVEAEKLLARKVEVHDSVIPSANTMLAQGLGMLAAFLEDWDFGARAKAMLDIRKDDMDRGLRYSAGWGWMALRQRPAAAAEVAIVGTQALDWARQLDRVPYRNLTQAPAIEAIEWPQMLAGKRPPEGQTGAWLCVEGACLPMVDSLQALEALLAERGYRN